MTSMFRFYRTVVRALENDFGLSLAWRRPAPRHRRAARFALLACATLALLFFSADAAQAAAGNSGGGAMFGGSAVTAVNTRFTANAATNDGDAFFVYAGGGQVQMIHTTIASPTLSTKSAVYLFAGTVVLTNTIVANHAIGFRQTGGSLSENHTLFDTVTTPYQGTITSGGNSITGTAAFFDTTNYTLTAVSAAINAGVDAGVYTDFFGDVRPQQGGFDIGYDESPFAAPVADVCFAEYTGDSATDFASADAQAVRDAVAAASPGGVVKIAGYCAGVAVQGGFTQTVYISKTLTLAGGYTNTNWTTSDPAANVTTLDAAQGGRVLYITGAIRVAVQDLRLTGGSAGDGGGVYNSAATTTISNTVIVSNTATNGGGIYNVSSGKLTVNASMVVSNSASSGGGGIVNSGSAITVTNDSLLEHNRANFGGGLANRAGGTAVVEASTIATNTVVSSGGGVNNSNSSSLTITNSRIVTNSAVSGGGIGNSSAGIVTVAASTIAANTGLTGGGISNTGSGSVVTVTAGTLVNANLSPAYGGGVSNESGGAVTVDASTVADNTSAVGGGVYNKGSGSRLRLSNGSLVQNNRASINGGGLSNEGPGVVTVAESTLEGNHSNTGGGIYSTLINASVTVTNSRILSNTADNSGGALYQANGSSRITGSCIAGNSDTAVEYFVGVNPIVATGNWWGHASGPSGAGPGIGDSVSSNVTFSDFLGAAILGCPTFAGADVGIAKAVTPSLAVPGQTITFTLAFGNTGARYARGVVISDSIPLSVTITGITSSTVGSGVLITQTSGGPLPSVGGDFAWSVGDDDGDLDPGESGVITLTGVVAGDAPAGLVITNTATITAGGDSTAGNNTSSAALTVARLLVHPAQPGVEVGGLVTISATVQPPQAGLTVNFTIANGGGGLDNASAQTDANGVATVLYTAGTITEVVQIEGALADAPDVRDRGIVYVAAETTAGAVATSASGVYTVGDLSPHFIQVMKTGAGMPPLGWAEFAGNPCPDAAPGSRVVSPYVDVMVDDTAGVETVVVTLKYTDTQYAAQHKLFWCNLGVWQQVTETVSIDPVQQTLVFTVNGSTTPALFQLAGTPFVGVGFVPTAATVGDFVAAGQADRVQITWQTLNEIGLYGFHLYRGLDPAGPGERITGDPLPAQGAGGLQGSDYSYDDFTPLPAATPVYYWLEELHGDGAYRHGPLRVGGAGSVRVFLPAVQQDSVEQAAGEPAPPAAPAAEVDPTPAPDQGETAASESLTPGVYLPLIGR